MLGRVFYRFKIVKKSKLGHVLHEGVENGVSVTSLMDKRQHESRKKEG